MKHVRLTVRPRFGPIGLRPPTLAQSKGYRAALHPGIGQGHTGDLSRLTRGGDVNVPIDIVDNAIDKHARATSFGIRGVDTTPSPAGRRTIRPPSSGDAEDACVSALGARGQTDDVSSRRESPTPIRIMAGNVAVPEIDADVQKANMNGGPNGGVQAEHPVTSSKATSTSSEMAA